MILISTACLRLGVLWLVFYEVITVDREHFKSVARPCMICKVTPGCHNQRHRPLFSRLMCTFLLNFDLALSPFTVECYGKRSIWSDNVTVDYFVLLVF